MDTGDMTPLEREYMLEFLYEDFKREKDAYDEASKR